MSNKLISLTPMLETPDVKGTVEFYTRTLGFICSSFSENWASVQLDAVTIMFSTPNEHRNLPAPIMSGSLYINTDNVNMIWDNLKDRCNVCYPIENFDYGMREFGVFDNNGYLLQFGQRIE